MCGLLTTIRSKTYRTLCGVSNLRQDVTAIYLFLTVCFLFRVQSLDIDSTVCRCTTTTKFGKPFVVLWNSPTEGCHVNFSVNIELEKYGILTNSNQTWDGEVVTVFYKAQLGLYPFYRDDNKKMMYNGGLPQLVNLTEHLKKASQHIEDKIPEPSYSGLAVIDWEAWRPLWETNFGKKRLYQTESMALIKKEGILKKKRDIRLEAKKRFERGGKRLMVKTIELAKKLRPRALWGFYGFPGCYGNITTGYHCTAKNKKWNTKLRWLFKSSTALFPSIYLMDEHVDNGKFVAERLTETFRISRMAAGPVYGHDLPVFPYLRPLYHYGAKQFIMLSEDDLENAIGQAVDYGSAGLILWGNHHDERTSREVCLKYNNYVNNKLGPYITLLTEEVELCSRRKCSSNGRCVEKSAADVELKDEEEASCRSINKHTTVFKMDNTTFAGERYQDSESPEQKKLLNITAKNANSIPHGTENTKIQDMSLLDQNKSSQQVAGKKNKSEIVDHHDTFSSGHNTIDTNATKGSPDKIETPSLLIEMFNSKPNKTVKKEKSDPVWNQNAIFGFKKQRKVDYLAIKKMAGQKNKDANKRGNGGPEMLNERKMQNSEDVNAKKLGRESNTTSSHKRKQKLSQKPGYSERIGEDTAVKVPGVYIILITVTLGGALLMTIIYVAIYYTVNVRGRSHDHSYDYEYGSGDENPFSVEPNSPWWNDDVDPSEKLLKNKKQKK